MTERRVVFYPRWTVENPATRLRAVAFAQELGRRGFATEVATSEVPVRWSPDVEVLGPLARTARRFLRELAGLRKGDVAYLVRLEAMPGIFPLVFALARRRGFKVVYDMDEAAYLRHPLAATGLIRFADGVVVAGHHLQRTVSAWNPRTIRVPTPVDMSEYPAKTDYGGSTFVIGFSGTPSNVSLLSDVAAPIRSLARRHDVAFRVVSRPDAAVPPILPDQELVPWRLETYRADIARFDVGIMVVAGGPWWKAKMGYKLVEYQASGVPALGSRSLGAERPLLEGETGFYAGTEAEWESALERLASDPALRERLGRAGRRYANDEYSLTRAGDRLAPLLRDLMGSGSGSPTPPNGEPPR